MSIQVAIETISAANIIEKFADTLNTMTMIGGMLEADRERINKLCSTLYGEAIALHKSANESISKD